MPVFDVTFTTEVEVVEQITAEDKNSALDQAEEIISNNEVGASGLNLDWKVDRVEEVVEELA